MRISDWSSDVCSSDLINIAEHTNPLLPHRQVRPAEQSRNHRLHTRALRRQSIAGSQVLCDLVGVRPDARAHGRHNVLIRSEEHTSELRSLMRISYAVFCLKKKK